IAFIIMQYKGWNALYDIGVPLDGNPSGSFFYLISGMHIAHILGGLAAIFVCLFFAFSYKLKVTPKRKLKIEMVVQYWHFVDALWIFLFTFLLIS
ncbi:MAG: cytochrome c oxidase subunit 3, partial [Bacteroidota bacterium]